MWDHYKKTFVGMQIVILAVTTLMLMLSHLWTVALTFFAIMQAGSALGAVWGARLRSKIRAGTCQPSLPRG